MTGAEPSKDETIFVRATGELKDRARIQAAKQGYSSVAEYVRDLIRSDGDGTTKPDRTLNNNSEDH